MNEACLGADDLGEMGKECDDIVFDLALDFVDALCIEYDALALAPNGPCRRLGHHADLGHGIKGMRFDLEPDLETGFGLPDRCHFWA